MRTKTWLVVLVALATLSLVVVSCRRGGGDSTGNGPATYTIGGIVSGLTGTGLVLRNNGADDLAIASDGTFTFATKLVSAASYSVSIKTMPANLRDHEQHRNGPGKSGRKGAGGVPSGGRSRRSDNKREPHHRSCYDR